MNIDMLGRQYLDLGTPSNLPDKVFLSYEQNEKVYHLKAFRATGGAMKLDNYWYYTQVEGALVLEFGAMDHHLLPQLGYPEIFVFTQAKESGFVADYSSKYRDEIPADYIEAFAKLLGYFKHILDA